MKRYARLIIGLSIVLGIAVFYTLYLSWPLLTGKTIVLATTPVDPFEVFRGQYLDINYEISTLPISGGVEGKDVYVILQEDQSHVWRYKNYSFEKPKEGVFIKGEIISSFDGGARVMYGIEQYFFERNAQFSLANMTVEAKVSSSGKARIVQLLKGGKPINISYQATTISS